VTSHLDIVFFDVGGPLYSDRPYYEGLLAGIREVRPDVDEREFWTAYDACRTDQRGPFTQRLAARLVDESQVERAVELGKAKWTYPPEYLQPDARETLERLHGSYRLGVLANQELWIRDAFARDGLDTFFDTWAISAEVGSEKPDPAIFRHALAAAGVPAARCVMIGDRLDNDIVPAKEHGMRAVWLLRGEAPDEPSPEQLAHADAAVRTLTELPDALAAL
jgi:HAD superfamily hydrolase (TIGR01549 family)